MLWHFCFFVILPRFYHFSITLVFEVVYYTVEKFVEIITVARRYDSTGNHVTFQVDAIGNRALYTVDGMVKILYKYKGKIVVITNKAVNEIFNIGDK